MTASEAAVLTVSATPTWARVPPGDVSIPVVLQLAAGDVPLERRRRLLALCLVLDVSGSMAGPALEQVQRSVERILGLLRDDDRVGVVAFSTRATVVSGVSALAGTARRAISGRVARLAADDRTNIEAGLKLGAEQLPAELPEGTKTAVVLLSDGEPNEGATSQEELAALAAALRPRASISTLGYGVRHDERVLNAIAESGGGAYRFIADPGTCQLELAQAVGTQGDIAVDSIEVLLIPEPGVEIERVLGASEPRFTRDGLVVSVPDLAALTARTLVVQLRAKLDPARALGALLTARVSFTQAGYKQPSLETAVAHVDIGGDAFVPRAAALAKALMVRADLVRAEARALADRQQFDGAAAILRGFMREIEAVPGYVAADGSDLSEAWEQLLDEAMAMERRPSREALAALKAAGVTRTFSKSDGLCASSKRMGAAASRLTMNLAGPITRPGVLVVEKGPKEGERFELGPRNTLGRTPSADITLPSAQISRLHADIFFLGGDYYVSDLGSTNPTAVNGKRLAQGPHKLAGGDLITIGDVELRFEQS
jgi:Ca-activated chloride channel family protein